jgi:hypothetical protein
MTKISRAIVTLRFHGDDLDPDELTRLIGKQPSKAYRKGDVQPTKKKPDRLAHTGSWQLSTSYYEPSDLDAQIGELLDNGFADLLMWRDLARKYRGNIFCGLFMEGWNEGLVLSTSTLLKLGERGLEIDLDVYGPVTD